MKGQTREMERKQRINSVMHAFNEANEKGLQVDISKLCNKLQYEYGVTEKVANDYIRVAQSMIS